MKRLLIILLFLLLPFPIFAEQIDTFDVELYIQKDGSIDVTEYIYYDFGPVDRHGIYREIPLEKTNNEGKKFLLDITNITVLSKTQTPIKHTVTTNNRIKKIKIGDPDKIIQGKQLYVVQYSVSGALAYYSDHDELYWNITGNDWETTIHSASINVHFPEFIENQHIQMACFTGKISSDEKQCSYTYNQQIGSYVLVKDSLYPSEGMSIVFGFPKDIVQVLLPKADPYDSPIFVLLKMILAIGFIIGLLIWYIGLPIWIIISWWKYGRDPRPTMGVTSAWFSPPQGKQRRPLTPGETGTLIDEIASLRDVTASIVDLARRGYVHIREDKDKEFYLDRTDKKVESSLRKFEKELLVGVFKKGNKIQIKKAKLASVVSEIQKQLYEAVVSEGFFAKNPNKQRDNYYILGTLGLMTANFPLGIVAFLFGRAMPKKTLIGAEQAAVAASLKNFLISQERQLEYQAEHQLMFEKLLPYAVAFGVEKLWAKRFEHVNLHEPDWYKGTSQKTFSSTVFANSLQSSMNSFTIAATPTTSSSGFSSGFSSGGGFSGGGGGGGGGGSW
ncbi:DUF2207 domain-containing protein [Patescibacteria group bacterium]